jgi:hypothetical protein
MFRIIPLPIVVVCLTAGAFADTVTLNNGEKLNGTITSKTDTEVTMSVKISAGISDERVIKKSDILKVEEDTPDALAWAKLKGIKLGKSSFPAASYDAAITSLKAFVTQYPKSPFAAEAQKTADSFTEEKERVESGEVKLDNKWLSKDESERERYQIAGLVALNYMRDRRASGDLMGALNAFDAIERTYPGSRAYPDAVELARQILPIAQAQVASGLQNLEAQKADREKGLKLSSAQQGAEIRAAVKRDQDAAEAALAAATRQGLKWPPLILNSDKSLQTINTKLTAETNRLATVPIAAMRTSIQAAEKARQALNKEEFEVAEEALKQAADSWKANELVIRLRPELLAASKAAAAAAKAPVPAPATPVPVARVEVPPPAPDPVAEAAEEPGRPFLLTPVGAITVLVLIAFIVFGVNTFRKFRKPPGENVE